MDMKKLFDDFVSHVNSMTDEDVRNSISNAVEHSSDETKNLV